MKKILFLAGMVILAASCTKDSLQTGLPELTPAMVPASIEASIAPEADPDAPQTKVSISGASPKWQPGDRIAVFTTAGVKCPAFTTTGSGSTATFTGTKPDGSTLAFAVYPYSAAVSASQGTYTLSVPAEQDGTIANGIMAAKAGSEGSGMVFSNLLSVIKMNIPSSLNVRKLEILGDVAVSGSFTVNGTSLTVSVPASPSDADKRLTVSGTLSGDVFACILPSTGRRLQMTLTNASGEAVLISKDLNSALAGGRIKDLGTVPAGLKFSKVALLGGNTSSQSYSSASQPSKPQVTNGGFETWTIDGVNLPNNWNSFQTASGRWAGQAYDSGNRQVGRSTDTRPGSTGNYSCKIWARRILVKFLGAVIADAVAQGNLTTGQVIAGSTKAAGTGNYNKTARNTHASVGNNPHYMAFSGRPDSLAVWVKFVPYGTDASHPYAKVETILHDNCDYQSGYNASDCTGGSHHIGEATDMTIGSTGGSWRRLSIPFVYDYSTTPSYILINIATNAYPGGGNAKDGSSGGTNADCLYIDDLEMIYNLHNLRTGSTGWASLYLGYDALVPSGATAYTVTRLSCGYAALKEISAGTVIPAGTGVLVKGSANSTYAFNGRAADVSGKTRADVRGNLLKGTLSSISRPSGTCRVLSPESSSSQAVLGVFQGATINANTAYLTE